MKMMTTTTKHIWILDPIYIDRTKQWRNSRPWTRDNGVLRCTITLYPFRVETLNGVNRIFSTLPISSMSRGITVTEKTYRKRRRNHARAECFNAATWRDGIVRTRVCWGKSHYWLFASMLVSFLQTRQITFVNTCAAKDDCIIITPVARI